jgi:adenylate cyclase
MIRRLGGSGYYFIDLGSSNGSCVNGRRVTTPVQLKDGDRITLGGAAIVFERDRSTAETVVEDSEKTTLIQTSDIRQIAILVADIRGYTAMSERTPVAVLTRVMSRWFRDVSDCIERNEGVVDKFIGDCVYARWDTANDLPGAVIKILRAAAELNHITGRLQQEAPEVREPMKIGVGINAGMAAVSTGLDYTALGDAVNLAFRLEAASKTLGVDVVLNAEVCDFVPPEVGEVTHTKVDVKGKTDPVDVCTLVFPQLDFLLNADAVAN